MTHNTNQELLTFLEESPSAFHAVDNIRAMLLSVGFEALEENQTWNLVPGGSYYVTRNQSSLIAFRLPQNNFSGFQITASHSDSPTFKIKESPELSTEEKYIRLNVEGYGGMLCAPWLDRPLSVAGRIITNKNGQIRTHLVNINEDLLLIPNLAIHLNRKANDSSSYNLQKDMLPLFGDYSAKETFMKLVADHAGISVSDIIGHDLYLYNRTKGSIWGAAKEYLSSPRLDDLQCAFATFKGFLDAATIKNTAVYCLFDNEEVGSTTKQGAASTFLKDILNRICIFTGGSGETYSKYLSGSFMVSADNAHAVHPNQPDLSDKNNRVYMNEGIVIKHSANQKYTTDAISGGIFKAICDYKHIPTQHFVNRSDLIGGSTLGNIANIQASMNTVDIGLPQLAMHSPYETAGTKDTLYLVQAIKAFYQTTIYCQKDGSYQLEYN